jgi:hypothetical protein
MSSRISRKKKKKVTYQVVNMANNFLSAFGLFMTIVIFTIFFILYQWKNVKIRNNLDEIDRLKQEILEVNSQVSILETKRNSLIAKVPARAAKQLGMITPLEPPRIFYVSLNKYQKYAEKSTKE